MFRQVHEGLTLMAAVPVDWGLQIREGLMHIVLPCPSGATPL